MNCESLNFGGATIIVCGRRKPKAEVHQCAQPECHGKGELQCDFPVSQKKTCDAYICIDHAHEVGPDRHYCPKHEICAKQDQQLSLFK